MIPNPLNVLIVDDSLVIRRRLAAMITDLMGVGVIGEASDAQEGIDMTEKLHPDVVIADIRMPGRSGIGMLEDMKSLDKRPTVIVLTNYPYVAYRRRCLDLGADHFFDKSTQFDRVLDVLREMTPKGA
jgi:YesN/AraC family two-component response regulator